MITFLFTDDFPTGKLCILGSFIFFLQLHTENYQFNLGNCCLEWKTGKILFSIVFYTIFVRDNYYNPNRV